MSVADRQARFIIVPRRVHGGHLRNTSRVRLSDLNLLRAYLWLKVPLRKHARCGLIIDRHELFWIKRKNLVLVLVLLAVWSLKVIS